MTENIPADQMTIYTDGACEKNPGGRGGYAVVMLTDGGREELSGGVRSTTNNRMELLSVIKGLESIQQKPCKVTVYSDSKYVVDSCMKGYAKKWQKNGWHRTNKQMAMNPDLWQRLLDLCDEHEVHFCWIRGHMENKENERCDVLAVEARQKKDLPPDEGYETPTVPKTQGLLDLW